MHHHPTLAPATPLPAPGHDHDEGLHHDLPAFAALASRRRVLSLMGGAGAALATGAAGAATCSVIPDETAGPYPADGSNNANGGIANALLLSGIVRSDIRSSVGGASGVAAGVPLQLRLRLVNTRSDCSTLGEYAIYLWHCTRDGRYSMYNSPIQNENYLRGVQPTGSNGTAVFTTIFPGCYAGRMPHFHFEVYRNVNTATQYSNRLKTSQLALPRALCERIYASTAGYEASLTNLAQIDFSTDNVFSDGYGTQLLQIASRSTANVVGVIEIGISI